MKRSKNKQSYLSFIKNNEKYKNFKLLFVFNIIIVFCNINCSNSLKILFIDNQPMTNEIPIVLSWDTSQFDISEDLGWAISNEGRTIRFDIEDSWDCVTDGNSDIQTGEATATITATDFFYFTPVIIGLGELQDIEYEVLTVKLDGKLIAMSESAGGDQECTMGEVNVIYEEEPPFILAPGDHTFYLHFTTGDSLYHLGAYYELNMVFTEID